MLYIMTIKEIAKGIDSKTLRRYMAARKAIAERADRISNVSHMLSLLKYCDEDTVPVSAHALTFFLI